MNNLKEMKIIAAYISKLEKLESEKLGLLNALITLLEHFVADTYLYDKETDTYDSGFMSSIAYVLEVIAYHGYGEISGEGRMKYLKLNHEKIDRDFD